MSKQKQEISAFTAQALELELACILEVELGQPLSAVAALTTLETGAKMFDGNDLAAFFQVITSGYKLVYEPASLLYHLHRRDDIGLQTQIYHYGSRPIAYLKKSLLENQRL